MELRILDASMKPQLYMLTDKVYPGAATPCPAPAGTVLCGECCDAFKDKAEARAHLCRRYCNPPAMSNLGKQFYLWCKENDLLVKKPTGAPKGVASP